VHAQQQSTANTQASKHNAAVDAFAAAVQASEWRAVSRYFQLVIDQLRDPQGFPRQRRAGYVPESTLLAIEWRLPSPTIIPGQKSFRWIKSRDEITEIARSATEIRQTYQTLVAQIALQAGQNPSEENAVHPQPRRRTLQRNRTITTVIRPDPDGSSL
jgi:restriction system protein